MTSLIFQILLLTAGLALIIIGANYLTDGAAAIARRANVSGFVVGLTVVAVGTSMPEMVVSVISSLNGSGDLSIGNIVGSNIFNSLVVLGVSALLCPIMLTKGNIKRDIPLGIIGSLLLLLATWDGTISRVEGIILLLLYIGMITFSILESRRKKESSPQEDDKILNIWLAIILTLGGLAALIYGGNIFLDNAIRIAQHYNIPSNVIAITLVAGGTSLPEFAASLVSLIKGKPDIALGNVIGSNIANILLVLGFSSTLNPLTMGSITIIDIAAVVFSSMVLLIVAIAWGRHKIGRGEGFVMLTLFALYITYMIRNSI